MENIKFGLGLYQHTKYCHVHYFIHVDGRIRKYLEFVADYGVRCDIINDSAAANLIRSVAQAKYNIIEDLCGTSKHR